MSEPPPVPTHATDDSRLRERLQQARADVLAVAADSAGAAPAPLELHTSAPVRPVPEAVRARVTARVAAGLTPTGTDAPSAGVRRRVALPCTVLSLIDLVVVVLAALTGHLVLLVIAAVLLLPVAAIGFGAARYADRDPLVLSAADRAAIDAACRWRSGQPWTETLAAGQEHALVAAAVQAASNAASSTGWQSTALDAAGARINLAAELDRVDAEAFAMASERAAEDATGQSRSAERRWSAAVDRVAALSLYGDELCAAREGLLDVDLLAALLRVQAGHPR